MSPKPDDFKILISKYRALNIEELKATIEHWEENTDCSNQLQSLDIAKSELELKYKERQQQIELLTQSLTSSSRFGRWISSTTALLKQFHNPKITSHTNSWWQWGKDSRNS
tara:strand:+ start:196 stop:528 length:333 start_codon:yes stop_codon:yes gene_type:complete